MVVFRYAYAHLIAHLFSIIYQIIFTGGDSVAIGRLVYILRIVLLSWGLYIMRETGCEQWFGVA